MLAKRIIPCLDVKDGRTVKGINFVGLRDAGDPVEMGKAYSEQMADELVYLDITASAEGRKTFTEMVRKVAAELSIPFTVGGGVSGCILENILDLPRSVIRVTGQHQGAQTGHQGGCHGGTGHYVVILSFKTSIVVDIFIVQTQVLRQAESGAEDPQVAVGKTAGGSDRHPRTVIGERGFPSRFIYRAY